MPAISVLLAAESRTNCRSRAGSPETIWESIAMIQVREGADSLGEVGISGRVLIIFCR